MAARRVLLAFCGLVFLLGSGASGAPAVRFEQSAREIEAYDFVEVALKVSGASARNPFQDVAVSGQFGRQGGPPLRVEGFCDSADGSLYRIRFMPARPGRYSYTVEVRQGDSRQTHSGGFTARDGQRRGLLRVDKEHPWHFVWEGTGEHYFWNGTTAYWLLGWQDEEVIRQAIDRLARLKVNRVRVALCGRTASGQRWYEPLVVNTEKFQFRLNPWVAQRPDSVENPGFDVARFNVPFWQKCERMLRHARETGMVVSIIFYLDGRDPGVDPFGKARMGCAEEQQYYRYAVARLAAFSNVMWDVTNEYHLFRDEAWTEKMGTLIKACDPYKHLTSVHGHGDFRFRTSAWADFAMYQSWDEAGGHAFMLKHRQAQAKTGRPIPQVNEEYGYEDHYPARWGGGRKPPARSADNRRRLAWGIYMAGSYQTTGERADRGTGRGADSGGGWINGRGDESMTMLNGYAHIVTCFTSLQWWKMEPRDDLVSKGAYCLAEPGQQYLVYLPSGGTASVKLQPGTYNARWFNPRTGQWIGIGTVPGPEWTSPQSPDRYDWAIVLRAAAAGAQQPTKP
ncbi:MAG: apiosidase-like domain-containing protein [Thermoguttaceae bacterium]